MTDFGLQLANMNQTDRNSEGILSYVWVLIIFFANSRMLANTS